MIEINLKSTEKTKKDILKSKTNEQHAVKSKKMDKTSRNLQKSLKFIETLTKSKQIHNKPKTTEKVE